MPSKTFGPATQLDTAQQWCIQARKKLKLKTAPIVGSNRLNLKDNAKAAAKSLAQLKAELSPSVHGPLEQRFLAIAKRLDAAGETDNHAQATIEAERLSLLTKELELEAATLKAAGKTKDSDRQKLLKDPTEAVAKARLLLDQAQLQQKNRYQPLLTTALNKLNEVRPIKYVVITAVEAAIDEARSLVATAGQEDWAGGADALARVPGLAAEAKSTAEAWQKEDLAQAAEKDHYGSKQRKIEEARLEIAETPGAGVFRKLLDDARLAGEKAIVKPHDNPIDGLLYKNGYEALHARVPSTSKLLKKAWEAAATATKSVDVNVLKAEKDARDALVALRVPGKELVGESVVDTHETAIDKALLLCAEPEKKPFGIKRLEEITQELAGLRGTRQALQTKAQSLLAQAEAHRDALLYAATESENEALQEPIRELRIGSTLLAALEFQLAIDTLAPLVKSLAERVAESDHTPEKFLADWQTEAEGGKGLIAAVRGKIERLRGLLPASKGSGDISDKETETTLQIFTSGLQKATMLGTTGGDPQTGLKSLRELSNALDARLERARSVKGFTDRAKLAKPANDELALAEKALEALLVALGKQPLKSAGPAAVLAQEKLDKAKTEWLARNLRAIDAAELAAGTALAAFTALKDEFARATATPQALKDTVDAGLDDVAAREFAALSKEVKGKLDELRDVSAAAYQQHLVTWTSLNAAAPTADLRAPTGPAKDMAALASGVQQAIAANRNALGQVRETASAKLVEATKQVKGLRTLAVDSLKSKHSKFFAPFFDSLDEDLKGLQAMVASTSIATVEASLLEFAALAKRVARLADEVKATPSSGDRRDAALSLLEEDPESLGIQSLFDDEAAARATPSFRLVMEARSAIGENLRDKNLAACLPVQKAMLEDDFKKLADEINKLEPDQAMPVLRELHGRVKETVARAAAAAERREQFLKTELPLVETRFQTLADYPADTVTGKLRKLLKDPKSYFLELENRIKAAKGLITEPQKEQRALADLQGILKDIDAVIAADGTLDPEELVKRETAAQATEFQRKKEATQWKALVTDFKAMDLHRAEEAVKEADGGDSSQVKDLKRMLKQAEDLFAKSGNFVGAVELLKNAKQYALRVTQHPQGLKPAARDELPKVRETWKAAVASFNGSVDRIASAIEGGQDDTGIQTLFEDDTDVDAATERLNKAVATSVKMVAGLKRLFNPNALDGPISVLTSKEAAAPQRRAAREMALQTVREYGDLLRKDPVLLKLLQKDQPFGSVDFYAINAALRNLDLNVQRAA